MTNEEMEKEIDAIVKMWELPITGKCDLKLVILESYKAGMEAARAVYRN